MSIDDMVFVSADDHVLEHPRVWTERVSTQRWGERVPQIATDSDGHERWLIDGQPVPLAGSGSLGAATGEAGPAPQRWKQIPDMAWKPAARLKAMDSAGVDYSVLYPSVAGVAGEILGRIAEPALELDCVRAYNDWLVEEWTGTSARFVAQCLVPLASVEHAATELRRAVGKGHRGLVFPAVPEAIRPEAPNISDPLWDPLWAACVETGTPLCLHAGSAAALELAPYAGYSPALAAAFAAITRPAGSARVLANLFVSGIFARFPKLKIVLAEGALGLAPFIVEASEYAFRQKGLGFEACGGLPPSQAIRERCHFVGWYERDNLRIGCESLGAAQILWATNFPLGTSTWPDTRRFVASSFQGLDDDTTRRVLGSNATKLYRLPAPVAAIA